MATNGGDLSLDEVRPGDTVLIDRSDPYSRRGRDLPLEEWPVAKVGRKYVTVEVYGRPAAYRIEDGGENLGGRGGPVSRAFTAATRARWLRRRQVLDDLEAAGIAFRYGFEFRASLARLEAILAAAGTP